jgi:hypothetical protein
MPLRDFATHHMTKNNGKVVVYAFHANGFAVPLECLRCIGNILFESRIERHNTLFDHLPIIHFPKECVGYHNVGGGDHDWTMMNAVNIPIVLDNLISHKRTSLDDSWALHFSGRVKFS